MKIVIVDYGIGNVKSIFNVLAQFDNIDIVLSDDHAEILDADGIILPGVGAFKKAIEELEKRRLPKVLSKYISLNKPLLGICLGMQLLFDSSEEFGLTKGLGFLSGKVSSFSHDLKGKLPHVGWNSAIKTNIDPKDVLFGGIKDRDVFYFVHSYVCQPNDKKIILSKTIYLGLEFCSSVQKGNIYGCQFHPEKSSTSGIKLIKNFIEIVRSR